MFRFIIISLLSSIIHSVSAMDIEAQIIKIRQADESNRYQLVNALKRELSQLGNAERMHAILALKQQMQGSSSQEDSQMTALASRDSQIGQNTQQNILDKYESVAAVSSSTMGTVEYTKGGVGAEVLDSANTGTVTSADATEAATVVNTQVTPSRPVEVVASNNVIENSVQQENVMQQTPATIDHIVNNVATTTLPQENSIQQGMRMLSYRI